MSKLKERILFMMLGGVLTLVILTLVVWFMSRTPAARAHTTVVLMGYQSASEGFFAEFGRWPTSSTEFVSNPLGIHFITPPPPWQDGWGRPIIYEPFTTNTGFGRAASYGRDGKPGGTDADADIELRFP